MPQRTSSAESSTRRHCRQRRRRIVATVAAVYSGGLHAAAFSQPITCRSASSSTTTIAREFSRMQPLHVLSAPPGQEVREVDASTSTTNPTEEQTSDVDTTAETTTPLLSKISEKIGKVDDDRIIFPEIENGQVPRLFSSLEYNKSEQGRIEATHAAGSVIGAASLVAGTMVGAGILALPGATASVGFLPSTVAMLVAWGYMTMSGLLIAELCLNRLGQSGRPGTGILDLFQESLGPKWGKVGSGAYFFLHYAVMVAYIAQGGVNLDGALSAVGLGEIANLPGIGQALFAGTCGLALFSATPAIVEKVNNVLVLVLAASFAGIIGLGAQSADFGSLVDFSNQHPENVAGAFPIIFLSLVYQNVVPTVVTQLEGDRKKITTAIVSGTTLPMLMFLTWNAVVLGNVQGADLSTMDPVALLQSAEGGGALLGGLVTSFSSIALITSLIGFTYGLIDAFTDVFKLPQEGPKFEEWKAALFALVFLPPLALSVTDPDIFFNALDLGGAFGVSTLFLLLPPIMVWGQRYGDDKPPLVTKPMGKCASLATAIKLTAYIA